MSRRHDIDALRALVFALLIAYHASGIWQRDSDFHIVSSHQFDWIEWARIVVNRWRMPLIFALSGMALALAGASARPAGMMAMRSWRLLLPLLFGMWFVVSVQAYCEAVMKGGIEPGFLHFWLRYAEARPWPQAGYVGAAHGITWNHLWYLAYLWCYTILLLALAWLPKPAWLRHLHAGPPTAWWLLGIGWSWACLMWLEPRYPETHALRGDWYAHANYFAFFLAGFLLVGDARFRPWLDRMRWRLLLIAVIAVAIELGLRAAGRLLPDDAVPDWALRVPWRLIERGARSIYAWTALLAILAWGQRLLDRPWPWLGWANESVYPWYMLHQTLLVLIAYWLTPLHLGVWLEVLGVIAGTVLGCWALNDGLMRRIRWLRPLFGLKPLAAVPRSTAPHRRRASRPG